MGESQMFAPRMDGQTHASSRKRAVFDQKNRQKIITPEKSETKYGKIRPFDIIPAMSLHAFYGLSTAS
jgi:hypothetical protein